MQIVLSSDRFTQFLKLIATQSFHDVSTILSPGRWSHASKIFGVKQSNFMYFCRRADDFMHASIFVVRQINYCNQSVTATQSSDNVTYCCREADGLIPASNSVVGQIDTFYQSVMSIQSPNDIFRFLSSDRLSYFLTLQLLHYYLFICMHFCRWADDLMHASISVVGRPSL